MNRTTRQTHAQGRTPNMGSQGKGANYRRSLATLFQEGVRQSVPATLEVLAALEAGGITAVVIGGVAVGCHSGRPRATIDLDLIVSTVPKPRTLTKIGKIVNAVRLEKHPSFLTFMAKSVVGDREVVDLITAKAGSYGLTFDHTIELAIDGIRVLIPTAEMLVVLKYTAAVNPIRSKSKQAQDWADIYAILDANSKISLPTMVHLADLVVPGYGEDLGNHIRRHRRG